jgi:hypothetical protein
MSDAVLGVEDGLRVQAAQCRALGANFTAAIIDAAAEDYAAGGVIAEFAKNWTGDPVAAALGLRFAGAFHYLANAQPKSRLGEAYRTHFNGWTSEKLRPLMDETARANEPVVREFVARAVQTNEVRRAAALLGGFLEIAKATGLPLDLYEIGASAGLLLNWDHYAYDFGAFHWGGGGLRIDAEWKGECPDWPSRVVVEKRAGCDLSPIDYMDDGAVARAASYIWAEQTDRRERFLAAIAVARDLKPEIERADAGDWLHEKLRGRPDGRATIVYQSVMAQYLSRESRSMVKHAIGNAAQTASDVRPLAWLRFEPDEGGVNFSVDVTMWPGGVRRRIAYAHPHGAWVEWLGWK